MKFCKICNTNITHLKGTFKCKEIDDELFELTTSSTEALKNLSVEFNQIAQTEQDLRIDSETPVDYIHSDNRKLNISELFANVTYSGYIFLDIRWFGGINIPR